MLDLVLAIGHHIPGFSLFGVLFSELVLVRKGVDLATVTRIEQIDLMYGVLAGLIIAVGFSRAVFAAKGWAYYSHNLFFHLKVGTFLVIGLLSIPPTVTHPLAARRQCSRTDAQDHGRATLACGGDGALRPVAGTFCHGWPRRGSERRGKGRDRG